MNETATRSLSCVMNDHAACQDPARNGRRHTKPGTIPGTGGKPCECTCHAVQTDACPHCGAEWTVDPDTWMPVEGTPRGDCPFCGVGDSPPTAWLPFEYATNPTTQVVHLSNPGMLWTRTVCGLPMTRLEPGDETASGSRATCRTCRSLMKHRRFPND